MKLALRFLGLLALLGLGAQSPVLAQCVSLTTAGSAVTQNFDTLANTGTTNNLTITGWFLTESGGGARDNEQYGADNGVSTTGDAYSYGAAGATDRALGGLQSGTLIPIFGACFTNNTGVTVTSLRVDYTGEQWRLGTISRTDQLDFQYSTNATSLVSGSWTEVDALDFISPFTATAGARDGNAAANRSALSHTIPALSIANGATFWIRWTDFNASGADDGLAVDDFSLTPGADPCAAVSFPYTLPDNAPATLITAIECANANGTADIIDINGQTVTLTDSFGNFSGATGLPQVTTAITVRNGTLTRSGGNEFRFFNVSNVGNLTVRDMTLTNGGGATYDSGGGIIFATDSSNLAVVNSTLSAGVVANSSSGGALLARGTLTIANSTISGNTAGNGGGLLIPSGSVMITNSVISGNVASNAGGAMRINNDADVAIINSTITGNYAAATGTTQAGGVVGVNTIGATSPTLILRNSIVWGNSNNGGAAPQIANSFGTNTATASIIQGGQFGALNADPLFVTPLTASPTPSTAGNFQLGNASPAIDAGANANVPADTFDVNGNSNTTEDAPDLAGNPRRYDDTGVTDTGTGTPPIVDLGAFEKQTNSAPLFPMDVDFCNLQFPTSFTAAAGSTSPIIYGRIYEDDNGVLTSNPGAHPSIVAQLGHGPLGSDPRGGNPAWQWLPATYNTQVGNDDEYQGTFIVPFAATNTQRSYTYRFSVDSGANYTYCDSDGNGTNAGLSFSTASLGTLTINPGAQPSISINDVSLNEGNSGTTVFAFTISLNGPSLNAVTFDIATADNTATVANGDYVANSASGVVIPAGQTSASFNVLVNGDTTFEPNETFFVNLSNVTGAVVGDAQGVGTIVNDDDPCAAYSFPHTVVGADNAARVSDLVQAINCANANATSDSIDLGGQTIEMAAAFAASSALPNITSVLSIVNGTITRTGSNDLRFFLINVSGDLMLDRVALTGGTGSLGFTADGGAIYNQGSVTLRNGILAANSSPFFGGAVFNGMGANLTVINSLISGNRADSTGGGIRNRGTLTVINSTIAGNYADTGGGIANAGGTYSVSLQNSVVSGNEALTGADIEDTALVTAQSSLVGGNPQFVAPLDASESAPTTGGNYRLGALSVAVDAGNNSLIPVGVVSDLDGNPRRVDDAGVPDTGIGSAPIVDLGAYERQDGSVLPMVSVTPTSLAVSEAGATTDSFVVALDSAPPSNVTIQLTFDGQVQVDAGSGFANSPQIVTLTPANALAGVSVNVRAVDDAIAEASPHLTTIVTSATSSSTPAFNGLAVADVSVSITDNDTAGVVITQSGGSTAVSEAGVTDTYTIVLSSQPTATVNLAVSFPASDLTVNGDTDGTYNTTFTSGNWNTPQTLTVAALNDRALEGDHSGTLTHTFTSADANYNGITALLDGAASNSLVVAISDNESAVIEWVQVSASAVEGTSNTTAVRLDISADPVGGTPTLEGTISYAITPAFTTAQAADIGAVSGALSFTNISDLASNAISIAHVDDTLVEGDEVYTQSLSLGSLPPGMNVTVSPTPFTGTITDNDSAVVNFAPVSVSQLESSSPMVFTVTLSNPVASGVTLTVDSSFGTATAADFTPIVGATVSFPPGSTANQTVNVVINNDALDEDDETFSLTLSNLIATGNVTLGSASATGTIEDDDATPTLSISSPSQLEGDIGTSQMNFVVTLSPVSGRDVNFTRATADGTATVANNDYVAIAPGSLSIPAGETSVSIPVTIIGDTTFEGDESFSLNLTGITNATPGTLSATGTILEDDQQATTTTVSSVPNPSLVGQPYAVNVTVSGETLSPSGTVIISDGTVSCGPLTLAAATAPDSTASCNLTSTSAGAKTLTDNYTALTGAFGNSSGTSSHQVNPATTTISVSGPPRSRINQPTSFSFALSVNAPGSGTPTGTVTLTSGAASCTATLPATSCNLSFSTLGSRAVSASYAGDANFVGSASSGAGNTQTLVYALSDLAVTKSDGIGTYSPDELLVYTVTVRNLGADAAANIRVTDTIPAGLIDVVWSCDASGGVACPQTGGSGNLDVTIAAFPVGGLLNFTFYGNVDGSPAQIVNTATLTLPADTTIEDPNLGNNSATDTNALDRLFKNGFENADVNAATGSFRLPGAALRGALGQVAISVYSLTDTQGEAVRIYARQIDDGVQYALATRDTQGRLRLASWRSLAGDPTLSWTARQTADGWLLQGVELR